VNRDADRDAEKSENKSSRGYGEKLDQSTGHSDRLKVKGDP